jgi:CubicO group peptidase (beta-lactamase class C family)
MTLSRRAALSAAMLLAARPSAHADPPDAALLDAARARAAATPDLRTLIVAQAGQPVLEGAWRGGGLDRPANIKSASKTVLAMLALVAVFRGVVGLDDRVAPLLGPRLPRDADPMVQQITLRHLLAMQAGLESTSGRNYGRWVSSPDWLRFALTRPMVAEPGGAMVYSTGTSHILGAVLARATGRDLRRLAQDWIGAPMGFTVPDWRRDPQGLHFGGNDMALAPRAMLAFGECCRLGGRVGDRQVLPEALLAQAWRPLGRSFFSGQAYGLGWWIGQARGQAVLYAWGYGGQMIYLVPGLDLTVVMTSDPDVPRVPGQVLTRHALLAEAILPAFGAAA